MVRESNSRNHKSLRSAGPNLLSGIATQEAWNHWWPYIHDTSKHIPLLQLSRQHDVWKWKLWWPKMIFHQLRKAMHAQMTQMFEMSESGTKFPSKLTIKSSLNLAWFQPLEAREGRIRMYYGDYYRVENSSICMPGWDDNPFGPIEERKDDITVQGTSGSRPHNCSHNPGNFLLLSDGSGAKFIPHFSLLFSCGQSEEFQ